MTGITIRIDSAAGVDMRLMFPALLPTTLSYASASGDYIGYKYGNKGYQINYAGTGIEYNNTGGAIDLNGKFTAAALYLFDGNGGSTQLAHLETSLDGYWASNGGLAMTSAFGMTPNNLIFQTTFRTPTTYSVFGGAGNDRIHGSSYGDLLSGGPGIDYLTGYEGKDTFYFDAAASAVSRDYITDFAHGQDKIQLFHTAFPGVSSSNLSKTFHDITSSKVDADDRILYNHDSGALYYDPDGNKAGGKAPVVFAVLSNHPTLDYHDFLIA